ncbi:MAG: SDR family NAD(P)-dependent oxidoreductase [Planctomycetes bacterium]|nr:SDR family NAD(P)-dependent oxidoreductase [Planctomycetota bacterium]MCB9910140.1 SDR family NAD(P)-dependent oxidoreductase [Planctomycetota bacterium]MCB9913093.1 SDR family NAD(P)-dependent oxidoreductase [Planctomycetota bacterium]
MNDPDSVHDAPVRRVAAQSTTAQRRGAIVVGASSGIGAALVRRLVREGYTVGAVARRGDLLDALQEEMKLEPGRVVPLVHDVGQVDEVGPAFATLAQEVGQLEFFVYAAGVMPAVEAQEYNTEKDQLQVQVNLMGAMAWCNQAAMLFHSQRSGTLIGIGSIAGDRGRKGNPAYHATKAGLATYLESLRNRLSEVGVHVLTVKPGFVDTPMTAGLDGLFWVISADKAAETILASARRRFWNTRYVPLRWWAVGTVIRSIPSFLFKRMNI